MMDLGRVLIYLNNHGRLRVVFDPNQTNFRDKDFLNVDWSEFYQVSKEGIQKNAPYPRGNNFKLNLFVETSHADSQSNWRSQTVILIYVNRSPIIWFSKRQNTVEIARYVLVTIKVSLLKSEDVHGLCLSNANVIIIFVVTLEILIRLRDIFILKNNALCVTLLYTKSLTPCVTF